MIFSNPCNPTGSSYTKEELKARVEELGHTWRDPLLPEFISIEELREEGSFINSQGITIHIDDILE